MNNIKEKIYKNAPYAIQNLIISIYNYKAYKYRYGGNYRKYLEEFRKNENKSIKELKQIQFVRLKNFLRHAKSKSKYYDEIISDDFLNTLSDVKDLRKLPILSKEDVRQNLSDITTISKSDAIIAKTGGTTGTSLKVFLTKSDVQHRSAHVDYHRSKRGYELGERTAWFSGKEILSDKDVKKNRFWKKDYYHNVRYYSTFHMNKESLSIYINDLVKYKPKYLIGFPSCMNEISRYGLMNKIKFPNSVEAIFPNAETIDDDTRDNIESFFNSRIYDQYGSSEGAPHIFEQEDGSYWVSPEVGVIEVLDDNQEPAKNGRLVVTPFFTEGTPLIRYDIGDIVERTDNKNTSEYTLNKIYGRRADFILSEETGKINTANMSNCSKNVEGIVKFKIVQNSLNKIDVYVVVDNNLYNEGNEKRFIDNIRYRVGTKMDLTLHRVEDLDRSSSGKFRVVENNL